MRDSADERPGARAGGGAARGARLVPKLAHRGPAGYRPAVRSLWLTPKGRGWLVLFGRFCHSTWTLKMVHLVPGWRHGLAFSMLSYCAKGWTQQLIFSKAYTDVDPSEHKVSSRKSCVNRPGDSLFGFALGMCAGAMVAGFWGALIGGTVGFAIGETHS